MSAANAGGLLSRAWAVCAKDAAQEGRRRIALGAVFFFAATSLALVAFAVGPFGVPEAARARLHAALLWIVLFFSAATGLPRAFVREEESGTAVALRLLAPASVIVAGKTLFNFFLLLAVAAATMPVFALLMDWRVASMPALLGLTVLASYGLAVVSTFLSALVARAGQRNVLFVLVSFPLLVPLLLPAIAGTVAAAEGSSTAMALRVLVAYDGAATCGAYLLAGAAWED